MTGLRSHEEVFFSLLRSAMWGTPACVPHGFSEWGQIVRLAKAQSVLGLVADVMLSDEAVASHISAKAIEKLKSFIMVNMMNASKLETLTVSSVQTLREAGVDPVLLKGHGLAANYPDPRLRQCGDVDLYVGQENYRRSYDALLKIADKADDVRTLDVGQHFTVFVSGLEVEVHRFCEVYPSRKLDRLYQEYSLKGLTVNLVGTEVAGILVNTPEDTYNCYYVFSHLFNHFLTGGIGLRQLCDWMCLIHKRGASMDVPALEEMIKTMGMMEPWKAFGCVLVDWLGLPENEFPLFERQDEAKVGKIVSRILEEGNFGRQRDVHTKKNGNYLKDKSRAFFGHITRSARLMTLFPSIVFRRFWLTMYNRFSKVISDAKVRFRS